MVRSKCQHASDAGIAYPRCRVEGPQQKQLHRLRLWLWLRIRGRLTGRRLGSALPRGQDEGCAALLVADLPKQSSCACARLQTLPTRGRARKLEVRAKTCTSGKSTYRSRYWQVALTRPLLPLGDHGLLEVITRMEFVGFAQSCLIGEMH